MEKIKAQATISLQNLDINSNSNSNSNYTHNSSKPFSSFQSSVLPVKMAKPPSLVSLCVAVIGKHLEDIIPELGEIAYSFPPEVKTVLSAIARRRKLLNDDVITSLADGSWEMLDISCSDVSDFGLVKVAEMCSSLRAVDISRCSKITPHGVYELMRHCRSLEVLRWGGCPRSDYTARRSLGMFKPELNNVEGDSWEELDAAEMSHGGHSLRWLVWPNIGPDTLENFSEECPRIKVNPQASPFGFKGILVPREALPEIVLDDPMVEDIDPTTWANCVSATIKTLPQPLSSPVELSVAEKFRLAFVERDTRLAPKRAKNARQHQRRAEREWMTTSSEAKALALASRASRSLHGRN